MANFIANKKKVEGRTFFGVVKEYFLSILINVLFLNKDPLICGEKGSELEGSQSQSGLTLNIKENLYLLHKT
jgi:hypothetical protein